MSLEHDVRVAVDQHLLAGSVLRFLTHQGDTGHRITSATWEALTAYYRPQYPPTYTTADYAQLFLHELLQLVTAAHVAWNNQQQLGILQTDYAFHITNDDAPGILYVPNQHGGITMLSPDDHPEVLW